MIVKHDIPDSWRIMLDELGQIYPQVVLAGGSLRDLDHGVAPKDLDIFIESSGIDESVELNKMLGGEALPDDTENVIYPQSMEEISLVSSYDLNSGILSNPPELPVQFIFCNWKVHSIWKRFDYGLTRIMFDGNSVFFSEDYERGRKDKVFELIRCDNEHALASSIKRYARFLPRYPEHGWRLACRLEMGFGAFQA